LRCQFEVDEELLQKKSLKFPHPASLRSATLPSPKEKRKLLPLSPPRKGDQESEKILAQIQGWREGGVGTRRRAEGVRAVRYNIINKPYKDLHGA